LNIEISYDWFHFGKSSSMKKKVILDVDTGTCLLYTSDAADE